MSSGGYKVESGVPFPGLEGVVFGCLHEKFNGYMVKHGQNLLYQVIVDETLKFQPSSPLSPTRGDGAFETDILITRARSPETPVVVIEVKASLTTHDVLTYSAKAAKHKSVYPHLRYGIAFTGESPPLIPGRFFTHNSAFDFAISMSKPNGAELPDCDQLVTLVRTQIGVSEHLIKLMNGTRKVAVFQSGTNPD